ncbi:MAG TPA: hypothetical protein VFM53_11750 [Anaeromyxobacteraceae bacterium]|nr:hypothetical protein [Anaeromyxobacteraceae bacterium]
MQVVEEGGVAQVPEEPSSVELRERPEECPEGDELDAEKRAEVGVEGAGIETHEVVHGNHCLMRISGLAGRTRTAAEALRSPEDLDPRRDFR